MIKVLKDTDGMFKLFQDKITKAYVKPPANPVFGASRYDVTVFVSEERLRGALGGAEIEVEDRSPPNNETVVPPISDQDIQKYLSPKEREIMAGNLIAILNPLRPGAIIPVDNLDSIKVPMSNLHTELINMAWECCSTRNKKQKESRRMYLVGYLDGIEKLSNSDEYRLQVTQIFDKHGMTLSKED